MSEMAPTDILFISHSTHRAGASVRTREILEELRVLLNKEWKVFVDYAEIEGGAEWRTSVLFNLSRARAAVILFDKTTKDSHWVNSEAHLLCFRRAVDPRFFLLPVLLDGLTFEDSHFDRHEPFKLKEVLALRDNSTLEPKAFAAELVARMPKPSPRDGHYWVEAVGELLDHSSLGPLRRAVAELGVDADEVELKRYVDLECGMRNAVAQAMFLEPIDKTADALIALAKYETLPQGRFGTLERFLCQKWVQMEAIELLVCAARTRTEPTPLFSLDLPDPKVIDYYFERLNQETGCKVFEKLTLAGELGENPETAWYGVLKQIGESSLLDRKDCELPDGLLPEEQARWVENLAMELSAEVESVLADARHFVFCTVPLGCVRKGILTRLRKTFRRIFFIAVDKDLPRPGVLPPEVRQLGPPVKDHFPALKTFKRKLRPIMANG